MKKLSKDQLITAFIYSIGQWNALGYELIKVLDQLDPPERIILQPLVKKYQETCTGFDKIIESCSDSDSQEKHGA